MIHNKNNRGDTIIEVLLAMTLLTMILFISWGLVNRTTQISLAARKRVEMVNLVKEQAEILKAKYAKGGGKTQAINSGTNSRSSNDYEEDFCNDIGDTTTSAPESFYFKSDTTKEPGSKPVDNTGLVWVQLTNSGGAGVNKYTDYFVRACWQSVGSQQKTDNVQVVVRLNDGN